jgi:hypothetical protein
VIHTTIWFIDPAATPVRYNIKNRAGQGMSHPEKMVNYCGESKKLQTET